MTRFKTALFKVFDVEVETDKEQSAIGLIIVLSLFVIGVLMIIVP